MKDDPIGHNSLVPRKSIQNVMIRAHILLFEPLSCWKWVKYNIQCKKMQIIFLQKCMQNNMKRAHLTLFEVFFGQWSKMIPHCNFLR